MLKINITLGNYVYGLRFLKSGRPYIVRAFSSRGYAKFMRGELKNGSGINKWLAILKK